LSSENEFKRLLVVSTFIGLIGSVFLLIGMIFDFISSGVKIPDLAIFAWSIGILIICLITFLGAFIPFGLSLDDERPGLFALALFVLAPMIILSEYTTPMFYLLQSGNYRISTNTAGFLSYVGFIGIILLLSAFVLLTWIFTWKRRFIFSSEIHHDDITEIKFTRFIRILTCVITIIGAIGTILGLFLPIDSISPSLLMSGEEGSFDLSALIFMIYIICIAITAIITFIANLGISRIPRSEIPLLFLLFIAIAMPGYTPANTGITPWSTPVYKILVHGKHIISDIVFMGWILIIGILLLVLAFMLGILTYFLKISATYVARPASTGRIETRKTKKPKRQPTGTKQVGTLANQLSTPSTQTSIQTGPPVGAQTATIPTGPPSASMTQTPEKPTCPFCGQGLRFIDEYQRWYCDKCAQYV